MPARVSRTIARARKMARAGTAAWVRNEVDAKAVIDGGCYYDAVAADRVIRFFGQFLRHSKGEWAGQPFELLEWQREHLIQPLFGWKRADGTRRFRKGGIWVPKKNGKSTCSAGISLYLLIADDEPGAEVYNAANDRQQATIVFSEAERMVRKSPHLMRRVQIVPSRKTIYYPDKDATYQALSADVPTKEGLNIHGLVVDEIHALRNRALWSTLVYGGAARRQSLILSISTAGVYDPTSIGWEQYDYARNVVSGANEDWAFFALIYEAGEKDDWTDTDVWERANPSWGKTIKTDIFAEECREAQESPAKQNDFRRYRLNQWVQQVHRWIPLDVWDANATHPLVTRDDLVGRPCYAGLDLGSVSDLTAWVVVAECEDMDGAVDVFARFWVPEAQLAARNNPNRLLYQQWVEAGLLVVTPGNSVDYDFIKQQVLEDAEALDVRGVNLDRLYQGQQLMTELAEEGLPVAPMGQGFLMMALPTKELERLWLDRKLHHGGHPILRWMADNVVVRRDPAGNLKVDKDRSPQKVDGIVALIMALDAWNRRDADSDASVYDHAGIEFISV